MLPSSHSQPDSTSTSISRVYRQALQPFTDPELLELSDHKPPLPQPAIAPSTVLTAKPNAYEAILTWLFVGACLLGFTYPAWHSHPSSPGGEAPSTLELPAS